MDANRKQTFSILSGRSITRSLILVKSQLTRSVKKCLRPSRLSSQATFVNQNGSTPIAEEGQLYPASTTETCRISQIRDNHDDDTKVDKENFLVETGGKIDRLSPEMCPIRNSYEKDAKFAVGILDDVINLLQSDFIAKSRSKLRDLSDIVLTLGSRNFNTPSGYGLRVLERGEEIFFDRRASCSVKHGTIILDSRNAQFYVRLINIVGAFATETSEFRIAEKSFTTLIELHGQSNSTNRLRGLGAAFNNRGCILLMKGEYKKASNDFQNSLRHLNCSKDKQCYGSSIHPMIIAVRSNISRLDMLSRHYSKAVTEQERLVEECKAKNDELPFQTTLIVLLNQAALYVTLAMFPKAEQELKFLVTVCRKMRREECGMLLNFVSLKLCEVLLLRAKKKEAERVFPFEALTCTSSIMHELMPTFEGLPINVRIESFEKMIDVFVQSGKIKFASELLEKGLKIVKERFGPIHFNVASLLYKQGTILKLKGELPGAVKKFEDSKEIWTNIFGENHPLLINCYCQLGDVAYRLQDASKAYLYFQRAVENVEVIHQVSFTDQLSKRYLTLTRNFKDMSWELPSSQTQEQVIEGLVAELGLALAVLLTRLEMKGKRGFQKRNKGKRPLVGKVLNDRHSGLKWVISQKCVRDLLKSGKKFLRHGMTREAFAFFKRASKHCLTYHTAYADAALVRLYCTISHANLTTNNRLQKSNVLSNCLEDIKADTTADGTEVNCDVKETLTFDNQLTLKLVLIFLILFSIHINTHDVTSAAYDFYSSQFINDDQFFFTLDGEFQVYASRRSVNGNGKTAVQDVFVASPICKNQTNQESHLSGNPLFKSVAFRSDEPTCNLLATFSSPFFLDVDDVKKLEQRIHHLFQEFFQVKCLGFESKVTQAVVDLTSLCKQDILACDSRIELLPLCLFELVSHSKVPNESGTISVITPGLCERITRMNFTDEQTTCSMFSRISLWFLKNCTWENMTTLRPHDKCLVLTVLDPVRARVTLWHKDISIMQKVQVIRIADRRPQLDGIGQEYNFCQDTSNNPFPCCKAIEQFVEPLICHCTSTQEVRCKASVLRRQCFFSNASHNSSEDCCETSGPPPNGFYLKEYCSSFHSDQHEAVRKSVKVSTLEVLTEISRLSRQLSEDEIEIGDESTTAPAISTLNSTARPSDEQSTSIPERDMMSSSTHEETISSNFELTTTSSKPDSDSGSSSSSRSPHSVTVDADQLSVEEEDPICKANDYANALGRKLFEEDRKSRRSTIAKFQEDLRKKEMWQKMNLSEANNWSENEISGNEVCSMVERPRDPHHRGGIRRNNSAVSAAEKDESREVNDERKEEHSAASLEVFKVLESVGVLQKGNEMEEGNGANVSTNSKPLTGDVNAINNGFSEASKSGNEAYYLQMNKKEMYQDVNPEMGLLDGNGALQNKKSIQIKHEGMAQSDFSIDPNATVRTTPEQWSVEVKNLPLYRSSQQKVSSFHSVETGSLPFTELSVNTAEGYVKNHGINYPRDFELRKSSGTYDELGQDAAKQDGIEDVPLKVVDETSVPLVGSCLGAGFFVSNASPQATKDVVDGPNSLNADTQKRKKVEALQKENVSEGDYSTHPLPQTTEQVLSGHTLLNKGESSKNGMQTSFQAAFSGCDIVADRHTPKASRQQTDLVVDSPASITGNQFRENTTTEGIISEGCKTGKEERHLGGLKNIDEQEGIHNHRPINFESPDVIDGPVKPSTDNANISYLPPDFGGARPKQGFFKARKNFSACAACEPENIGLGLDPDFVERHRVSNSLLTSVSHNGNLNGATWDDPPQDDIHEHYFSAKAFSDVNTLLCQTGERPLQNSDGPRNSRRRYGTIKGSLHSLTMSQVTPPDQDESWYFPLPSPNRDNYVRPRNFPASEDSENAKYVTQEILMEGCEQLFNTPTSQNAYNEMRSLANEFNNGQSSHDEAPALSTGGGEEFQVGGNEWQQDTTERNLEPLLESLRTVMSTTLNLFTSVDAAVKHVTQSKNNRQHTDKLSIEEQTRGGDVSVRTETAGEVYSRERTDRFLRNEQTVDTEREDCVMPIQERPRSACSHYQRRCLVSFPCCGRFFPCHRCHNESTECNDDQARAINATHIRCTICHHKQEIDEGSQKCRGCNSKMSDYFCAICKHFTSLDKNPFHCDKCGICRIHRDKSFHCDVCNVCLDKRLEGKHKCRPDSGHDECCICLEDAFSGCQILPCSHKVHKDCAIAMIQNGVRTCPICRHPLFQQSEGTEQ